MKKNTGLCILWAVLYCACVGFSFVSHRNLGGKIFLMGLNLLFFVPPFVLVIRAAKEKNRKALKTLRLVCIVVLALAMILLSLNIMSVKMPTRAGTVLFVLLAILAPPLACANQWALSLFLWACVMMLTFPGIFPDQK